MAGLARRSLATLTTFVLLAVAGFSLGALAGILWEQPRLILSYLTGGTTEIAWRGDTEAEEAALPDVAAGPETIGPVKMAVEPRREEKTAPPEQASKPATREAPPKPAVAAPEPVAAPPLPRAPKSSGPFAIQVGAFGSSEAAEGLANRLTGKGYDAYVTPGAGGGQTRWRVRVGPLADKASADSLAARLKKNEKLPTWILDKASN